MAIIGLLTGKAGVLQTTGVNGDLFLGPPINDYFHAGIQGATATNLIATGATAWALVPWNNPIVSNGPSISQATTSGTGAAHLSINAAGIYEITYTITPIAPPVDEISGQNYFVHQLINATGTANQGSAIAQSFSYLQNFAPASQHYLASLQSGCTLETWVDTGGVYPNYLIINSAGTVITVKRVG